MQLINNVGCTIEGEFTGKELEKFKIAGWTIKEENESLYNAIVEDDQDKIKELTDKAEKGEIIRII